MPPVIAGAVLSGALAYGGGITVFGLTALQSALVIGATNLVLGGLSMALQPHPKAPSFQQAARDRGVTLRQAVSARPVILGTVRTGGVVTFVDTYGPDNAYLAVVITLAGHKVKRIGTMYFDGVPVDFDATGEGYAIGKYAGGYVYLQKNLGAADQPAFSWLVGVDPGKWTADHRQAGCAGAMVQMSWSPDLFPNGLPNITFDVEGCDEIHDPRTGLTGYSDNAALCTAWYLADPRYGLGASFASEISLPDLIEAANICDERVAVANVASDVTPDLGRQHFTLATQPFDLGTGDEVRFATTGTMPAGLVAGASYYWFATGQWSGAVAASPADALAGNAVAFTDAGGGTLTLTRLSQARYTMNGRFTTDRKPVDIVQEMLSAMGGSAGRAMLIGGVWVLHAGAYRTPTVTLNEDDFRAGTLKVFSTVSARESFNSVKGVFSSPVNAWQPGDYPAVTSAAYVAADGGETVWKDMNLAYTSSPAAAQRIATLELNRARQEMTVQAMPCKLTGYQVQAGDTVLIDNARMGWTAQPFEVVSSELVVDRDDQGAPFLGVDLTLRQTDPAAYAWAGASEQPFVPARNSSLPDPFQVAAPTGLTLSSGTAQLFLRRDGTVFSRIQVDWTPPADGFVTVGGRIEIQARRSSEPVWQPSQFVDGALSQAFILDVQDGVAHDVRVRAVNSAGVRSAWVEQLGYLVVGKTAPPGDVTGLSVQQNGNVAIFTWRQIADPDLAGYEIRFGAAGAAWEAMTPVTATTRGTQITTAAIPPGTWAFGIKAVDTSGNYSADAGLASGTIASAQTLIASRPQAPDWLGSLSGLLRHWTGALMPESVKPASLHTNAELFERFVSFPVAVGTYDAPEIDLGFDDDVRVYAAIAAVLGPGIAGTINAALALDWRTDAGAYGGAFQPWTVGTVRARFIKPRLVLTPGAAPAYVTGFAPTVDAALKSDGAADVAVAAGGSLIGFAKPFHNVPKVQLTAQGTASRLATSGAVGTTGFTAHVFDPATGADVGGTITWAASGV